MSGRIRRDAVINQSAAGAAGLVADPTTGNLYPLSYPRSLPKLAAIGDSMTKRNTDIAGLLATKTSYGFITHALVKLRQQIQFDNASNFGVSGDTTTQMLARLQACSDVMADFYTVLGGTNDVDSISSFASASEAFRIITGNLETIYVKLLSRGAYVIAFPIPPRSLNMTTAKSQLLERINNWIRAFVAAHARMLLCDANRVLADQSSATGAPLTGVTNDLLHWTPTGALLVGLELASVIGPYLPSYQKRFVSPTDVYDSILNPGGNLLTNGCMSTPIAATGTGISGTRPTGWTAERGSSTGSVVFTNRARADGQPGFETEISSSVTAATAQELYTVKQQVLLPAGVVPGDLLYAECEIVMPTSARCTGLMLRVVEYDGAVGYTYFDMYPVSQAMPTAAWSGMMRTPLIVIRPYVGPAAAYVEVRLQAQYDGSDAVVPAVGAPAFANVVLKKVLP